MVTTLRPDEGWFHGVQRFQSFWVVLQLQGPPINGPSPLCPHLGTSWDGPPVIAPLVPTNRCHSADPDPAVGL